VVLTDAIRLVEELVGRKATLDFRPLHPADVPATWADISKSRRLLGWRPQVGFQDGVAALVEWYRQNRDWTREIATA
jgi:nucleoside-diphosphate-sugar epimerase